MAELVQANQYQTDPRQTAFLKAYLDPKSDTWSNAKQSALKVGYAPEYADNIMSIYPDWLSDAIGDTKLIQKATRNLDMALDGLLDDPEKGGKPLQLKATEITLRGLQKTKWSERQEVTGKDGSPLVPQLNDDEKNKLKELLYIKNT